MGYLSILSLVRVAICLAISSHFAFVKGELPLDLGLAEPYAILAGTTVTSTGVVGTVVTGNIGIFPGSAITGFPPAVLNGAIDAANGASGGAQGDLTTAYNVLASKAFNTTLSNQDLGGMTLFPGVYKFDAAAAMNGMLTLDARGDPTAVWTFQIGSSLLIAEGSSIIFKNSIGNPDYVYWQVGSSATLAIGVPMIGNILALTAITVNNGATVKGRCLARNAAVTLDKSVITKPSVVSFHAKHSVSGISLESYNNNPTLNSATLKDAIAETMPSISTNNIKKFVVTSGTPSAAGRLFLRSSPLALAASNSSIVLNYDVIVSTTHTTEELQAQLKAAVNDGTFNHYLQGAATRAGATDLLNSTSSSVETYTITDDTTNSADSAMKALSTGAIIGIAVGAFFVLLLILGLIYYYSCRSASVGAAKKGAAYG